MTNHVQWCTRCGARFTEAEIEPAVPRVGEWWQNMTNKEVLQITPSMLGQVALVYFEPFNFGRGNS